MVRHKAISDGKTHYSQNFKDQVIEALVTDTQTNIYIRAFLLYTEAKIVIECY